MAQGLLPISIMSCMCSVNDASMCSNADVSLLVGVTIHFAIQE